MQLQTHLSHFSPFTGVTLMRSISWVISWGLLGSVGFASTALAQTANGSASKDLHTRALAATCANCHGTEGNAAPGSAVPGLAGMNKVQMQTALKAFRDGTRPATVMHQLTKGFTEQQIDDISSYYAAAKR
jgi:cytochrome subunit of sulfide dehydrogenase